MSSESSLNQNPKVYKVSKNLNFRVLESNLVKAQDLLNLEGFNLSFELIRDLSQQDLINKFENFQKLDCVAKLDPVAKDNLFYKVMQLKDLKSVAQLGLILNSYNIRVSKQEVEQILKIL